MINPVPHRNEDLSAESFDQACVNLWAIWAAGHISDASYAHMLVTLNRHYFETGHGAASGEYPVQRPRYTPAPPLLTETSGPDDGQRG